MTDAKNNDKTAGYYASNKEGNKEIDKSDYKLKNKCDNELKDKSDQHSGKTSNQEFEIIMIKMNIKQKTKRLKQVSKHWRQNKKHVN